MGRYTIKDLRRDIDRLNLDAETVGATVEIGEMNNATCVMSLEPPKYEGGAPWRSTIASGTPRECIQAAHDWKTGRYNVMRRDALRVVLMALRTLREDMRMLRDEEWDVSTEEGRESAEASMDVADAAITTAEKALGEA